MIHLTVMTQITSVTDGETDAIAFRLISLCRKNCLLSCRHREPAYKTFWLLASKQKTKMVI